MAFVRGIHLLAHGDKAEAQRIADDIRQHNRLKVGPNSFYGTGVYAWYEDFLPPNMQHAPQVLFEVDEKDIIPVHRQDGTPRGFFRIPGSIGDYVSVRVIRFANLA
jgi:hypothetical protein